MDSKGHQQFPPPFSPFSQFTQSITTWTPCLFIPMGVNGLRQGTKSRIMGLGKRFTRSSGMGRPGESGWSLHFECRDSRAEEFACSGKPEGLRQVLSSVSQVRLTALPLRHELEFQDPCVTTRSEIRDRIHPQRSATLREDHTSTTAAVDRQVVVAFDQRPGANHGPDRRPRLRALRLVTRGIAIGPCGLLTKGSAEIGRKKGGTSRS